MTFLLGRQLKEEEKAVLGETDEISGGIPQPDDDDELDDTAADPLDFARATKAAVRRLV